MSAVRQQRIAIRADSSVQIGGGHVMRCLALADELRRRGAEVTFVCRQQLGDSVNLITGAGFAVEQLSSPTRASAMAQTSGWLGRDLEDDADGTARVLRRLGNVDWLVVDHYALDRTWESIVRPMVRHVLAIDDLANRPHDCDILLDQNFPNALHAAYTDQVPSSCKLLVGPRFSLIRPEFSELRAVTLARRSGRLDRLLVFMGATDPANECEKVLVGLANSPLRSIPIDVVLGSGAPHRHSVQTACSDLPRAVLHVQTPHMARLMAEADCAVSSSGSITWERCVLGLPALVTVMADNQLAIAEAVAAAGAHRVLGVYDMLKPDDYAQAVSTLNPNDMRRMSRNASEICDGLGASRVAAELLET